MIKVYVPVLSLGFRTTRLFLKINLRDFLGKVARKGMEKKSDRMVCSVSYHEEIMSSKVK